MLMRPTIGLMTLVRDFTLTIYENVQGVKRVSSVFLIFLHMPCVVAASVG